MTLFVNQDESREHLSIDLKALNIPKFNDLDYIIPFGKLISRIWHAYSKNQVQIKATEFKILILELEKYNSELQKKILQIEQSSKIDITGLIGTLERIEYEFNGNKTNLLEFFVNIKNDLADGCNYHRIWTTAKDLLKIETENDAWGVNFTGLRSKYRVSDFTGELILKGLIEIKTSNDLDQFYFLTKQGIGFANEINIANKG